MLDWLSPATDPYDAQDRVRAEIARRDRDEVAAEVLAALRDPLTPAFQNDPDVFADDDVDRIVRAGALDAAAEERLRRAIAEGRAASG